MMRLNMFTIASIAVFAAILTSIALNISESRLRLIWRLEIVESNSVLDAVGDSGEAHGPLQFHSVMVAEANRVGGTNYTLQDMENRNKAELAAIAIFRYYDKHIQLETGRHATDKELAFIWNGGGSAWRRVEHPRKDAIQERLEQYWIKVQNAQ